MTIKKRVHQKNYEQDIENRIFLEIKTDFKWVSGMSYLNLN